MDVPYYPRSDRQPPPISELTPVPSPEDFRQVLIDRYNLVECLNYVRIELQINEDDLFAFARFFTFTVKCFVDFVCKTCIEVLKYCLIHTELLEPYLRMYPLITQHLTRTMVGCGFYEIVEDGNLEFFRQYVRYYGIDFATSQISVSIAVHGMVDILDFLLSKGWIPNAKSIYPKIVRYRRYDIFDRLQTIDCPAVDHGKLFCKIRITKDGFDKAMFDRLLMAGLDVNCYYEGLPLLVYVGRYISDSHFITLIEAGADWRQDEEKTMSIIEKYVSRDQSNYVQKLIEITGYKQ